MSEPIYIDKEEMITWDIDSLRSLHREVKWALKSKEDEEKITVFCIEEYEGCSKAFLSFEKALGYVMDNIEQAYRSGLQEFIAEGRPSYIKLEGHAPRITTRLYLPSEIASEDKWFILDKEEKNDGE